MERGCELGWSAGTCIVNRGRVRVRRGHLVAGLAPAIMTTRAVGGGGGGVEVIEWMPVQAGEGA